jgi:hypothetical protein
MTLLSGFLFFVAGILFGKVWSSLLDFGILSAAMEKVTRDLLISLILIEQDVQFALEAKKLILKEKGMSEEDIEHYSLIHGKTYGLWKEKVIITLVNNYPSTFRDKHLPFHNWEGAVQYMNELIKKQKLASRK